MSKPTPTAKSYLRIGQIAERCGVSAKALRLYEQRGLLKPCAHSEAGYRLYGPDALRRLMQIIVLKRSGFTLAEIAGLQLSGSAVIASLLDERIQALRRDMADKALALSSLEMVADRMGSASTLDLNQLLESITMTSKLELQISQAQRQEFYERAEKFAAVGTPEERANLRQRIGRRLDDLGAAGLEAEQQPWRELSAAIRAAMNARTPATDPAVAGLAVRWHAQVKALIAIKPDFLTKLREVYTQHPELMVEQSMSPAMMDYMTEAMAAAGISLAD